MLSETDRDLLMDILEHGQESLTYLEGTSYPEFLEDRRLRLVTERLLEIIGEAAGHLSETAKQEIPYNWRAARGLKNILSHQYGSVDPAALYTAATKDLPGLIQRIQEAIAGGDTG